MEPSPQHSAQQGRASTLGREVTVNCSCPNWSIFMIRAKRERINQPAQGAKLSWLLKSWVPVIAQVSLFVLVSCDLSFGRQRPSNTAAKRHLQAQSVPGRRDQAAAAAAASAAAHRGKLPAVQRAPAAAWPSTPLLRARHRAGGLSCPLAWSLMPGKNQPISSTPPSSQT